MKNSTKILVGVVVVALVGAGVYFGNTKLQKGSFQKINFVKPCKSEPSGIYSNFQKSGYNYSNFEDLYNYVGEGLNTKKEKINPCPYLLELSAPKPEGGEQSTTLTCKNSELTTTISNSGNRTIICHKQLNEGWVEGVLYHNKGNPVARIYTASEGFQQDIEMSKISVKKY